MRHRRSRLALCLAVASLAGLPASAAADSAWFAVLPDPHAPLPALSDSTLERVGPRAAGLALVATRHGGAGRMIMDADRLGIELTQLSLDPSEQPRLTEAPAEALAGNAPQLDAMAWHTTAPWTLRAATLAVVDTGYDARQPDFGGRVVHTYDASRPGGGSDVDDLNGHGTGMLGIAGAAADGRGAVGVAPHAPLVVVRLGTAAGFRAVEAIRGELHAAGRATVVSMSYTSFEGCDFTRRVSMGMIVEYGGLPVAGVGNASGQPPTCPAVAPHVLGVGWAQRDGTLSPGSSRGAGTDVTVLGDDIPVLEPGRARLRPVSGSSPATAAAAGAAALLAGRIGDNTGDRLLRTIIAAARRAGTPAPGVDHGPLALPRLLDTADAAPDLDEPNEDVYWARRFPGRRTTLRRGSDVRATVGDRNDPRDVYRVRLPGGRVRIEVTGLDGAGATVSLLSGEASSDSDDALLWELSTGGLLARARIRAGAGRLTRDRPAGVHYLAVTARRPGILARRYRLRVRSAERPAVAVVRRRRARPRLSVTVRGGEVGRRVTFERRGAGRTWVPLATARLDRAGRASLPLGRALAGGRLRVRAQETELSAATESRTVSVP